MKVIVYLKNLKGAPLNTQKLFFLLQNVFFFNFFYHIHNKMHFILIQNFFQKNLQVIKKNEIIDRKVFKL